MALLDKITKFFDAAKDLALEAVAHFRPSVFSDNLFEGAEMIPIIASIDKRGKATFEIRPKVLSVVIGAKSFMDPKKVLVVSVKQTLGEVRAHVDPLRAARDMSNENRGPDAGFDIAYFNTDEVQPCPFDFGDADPDHPILIVVDPLDCAALPIQMNMVVWAKPIPADAKHMFDRLPTTPTQ